MSKYIFNVTAIVIDPKATGHGYKNHPAIVEAKDIDEALKKAAERFKTNKQFKFEYAYAGKE